MQHRHGSSTEDAIVPWFPDPMSGWNEESESFSPRHEASTIELFFDLWFVANLATFTQYHAITNRYTFWSYIAFFMVLWTSWFHVVCFDARFTSDSVWERASKTVHFCAFAAFALMGYKFAPVSAKDQPSTPHWIYRTMCFAVLLSRAWLALQYLVTTIMCSTRKHRAHRLTLPLTVTSLLFLSVAAVFGGLFAGFRKVEKDLTGVLIGVYVVLAVEFFGSLAVSMFWRKLSFRATHVGERLGLLGLIIIGEGVIGLSKTIVRTMGKNGPNFDSSAQVFCIILILVFMWILYFDKVPRYRFGMVKQQIWMGLHLPFHLAILGVVEGAQQLAQARYIYYNTSVMIMKAWYGCVGQHLDGQALASNLTKNIEYFKMNESARGTIALETVYDQIYILGNTTNVCSPANTTNTNTELLGIPYDSFHDFFVEAIGAMYQSFDIDIPFQGHPDTVHIAFRSWLLVYTYFWSAIILLLVCYTITSLLAETEGRGHWRSFMRYVSLAILSRAAMIALAVVMLAVGLSSGPLYLLIQKYIMTGWLLPTVVLALWTICIADRVGKMWQQRSERKTKYESVAHAQRDRPDEVDDAPVEGIRRRGTNVYGYPAH
ncbi:bacterial low temperature requirement A protein-domain-containing protein [Paraphoma chrysanthemicola]|uniref:Bacterial low temperature requirement A protein-domain-containing protein n=1 Tax=Paraphoma chrysanthemicola TaxID=798071 RepID=A0A8K0R8Q9_9PLEO|nr:bacterial low temperature requirement A protein-domain-containing protein [Paraphoma chrysanthemicola]